MPVLPTATLAEGYNYLLSLLMPNKLFLFLVDDKEEYIATIFHY
jgi:hypothetical protein